MHPHKTKSYTLRTIFFITFLFTSFNLLAQNILAVENGIEYNSAVVKPFLHTLHEQNDYVIAFRVVFPSSQKLNSDYFILTRIGQIYQAFRYIDGIEKLSLPDQKLELIWKNLVQNDLFSMKDEIGLSNFCPKKYHVYNSYSYEFTLISKDKVKTLSYYYPEHYDEACFGMSESKMIINAVCPIDLIALNDLQHFDERQFVSYQIW